MTTNHHLSGNVHQVNGLRKGLLKILAWILRIWQRSLRLEGLDELDKLVSPNPQPHLILLWHNRLFAAAALADRLDLNDKKMGALISASRDGAQLALFVEALGIVPVRGSSSRRGAIATRQLVRHLQGGRSVVITVDGPRGPCYRAQSGAAMLVAATGAPVLFLGCEAESAFTLKSWDRFVIPLPFSRIRLKLDRLAPQPPMKGREVREAIQASLQERLSKLTRDSHLVR